MDKERFTNDYNDKIQRVLISEREIQVAVRKAAEWIERLYDGSPILLVGILNGAFVFMSDICRAIRVPCEIAFMNVKSYYSGRVSSGEVEILLDLQQDISAYHVVIIEDIIDTGRTLKSVVNRLKERNPLSLRVVTLLNKPSRRQVEFESDYTLFTIPDTFVVGYGLDCAELYRNLPYIAEYKE